MTTLHDRAKLAIQCFSIFDGPVSQLLGFKKKVRIINQVLQLYIFHIVCQLYKSAYAFVSTVQQYCISTYAIMHVPGQSKSRLLDSVVLEAQKRCPPQAQDCPTRPSPER